MTTGNSSWWKSNTIRMIPAVAGCMLPLVFPEWSRVMAEDYILPTKATTPNSENVGLAINQTCLTGNNAESSDPVNQQFQEDCDVLVGGASDNDAGVSNALNQVTDDEISAQNTASIRSARIEAGLIAGRLQTLRVAGGSSVYAVADGQGLDLFSNRVSGGAASADASFGRLGFFFSGKYFDANENSDEFQPGYENDGFVATAGLDYRFNNNAVAGVAFGYTDSDGKYDNNGGHLDYNSLSASIYGTYYLDNGLYFDGMVGYGSAEYKMDRNIFYSVSGTDVSQVARSKPDADRYSFSVGTGYNMAWDALTLTPTLRVDYLRNEVDGIKEKTSSPTAPGGTFVVKMDSNDYESLTSNLGGGASYALKQSWGVLLPQVSLEWVHEFENDGQQIDGFFPADINQQGFTIETKDPDRDYFNARLGVSAQFAEGRSGFISYEKVFGYDDVDYYSVQAGVRLEF
jgi:outer membrane autotransporter protein